MPHEPAHDRHQQTPSHPTGKHGLQLPAISLGFWNNFTPNDDPARGRAIVLRAFDLGITSMDLSNNYGEPFFANLLKTDLHPFRDELVIASKCGYHAWPGPHGFSTCRKALRASVDRSLRTLGIEYLDILYAHRHDPNTPVEETMAGLADLVRQGKVLYPGISNFGPDACEQAAAFLESTGVPLLIHEVKYSMLTRNRFEGRVAAAAERYGFGTMAYCPLEQGILTEKYLSGELPGDSRAAKTKSSFQMARLTQERITAVGQLQAVANARSQTLVELAFNWVLAHPLVTSALTGASRPEQLDAPVKVARNPLPFTDAERQQIDTILTPVLLE